ncbi:MAG: hypothetical protein P9F19_08470 [Candidatus Contendobacter sp.]|nr:hypothetical protein [Candidatus Contendobacter sp.]MDG4557406.1 hypothetical protein [Candidatus Contendobacter sp.]
MNATIRIRRAQLRGAMTSGQAREIAILRQGRRLAHAGAGSRQRAALAGITAYWTSRAAPDPVAGLGHSLIPLETAVW